MLVKSVDEWVAVGGIDRRYISLLSPLCIVRLAPWGELRRNFYCT